MDFFKRHLHEFIAVIVAAAICGITMMIENSLWQGILSPVRLWCDGTFVTGVLFLGIGGLNYIAQHGGFDALRFAMIKLKDRFLHPKPDDRADEQTYYDYVVSKRSNKKKPVLYLLLIGAVFLAAAIILAFYTPDAPMGV